MLQQILNDMHIEPELLAELDEEQKQSLFCKMREEQVRKWKLHDLTIEKEDKTDSKAKQGGKKVSFKVGQDGEPIVAVIGNESDEVETMLEEKAKHQAELECDALRLAAEEELDKLVNLSYSTVQQMDTDTPTQDRDPTREAVVQSLQEAKQELEDQMRSESEAAVKPETPNAQDKDCKDVQIQPVDPTKINSIIPKNLSINEKPVVTVTPHRSKGSSQTSNNNVPFSNSSKPISSSQNETKPNRGKLKDSNIAPENNTSFAPLYLASGTSANSTGSSSMVTIRSMTSNPISDFPVRQKTRDEIALGVAAHVQQYERLSTSSLEALKTATLERAKKRRQREILDYLRQQVDLAKSTQPEEKAWREQERRAKNAEKRIREIARRARAEHRRVSIGSDDSVPVTDARRITSDRNRHLEDINGNMNVELENSPRYVNVGSAEANTDDRARHSDVKPERLRKPSIPPSKNSIIEWFRLQELPKGSGLDPKRQNVAKWFHGIISRNEAEEFLMQDEVGSFLVRVSERIWGYVVSYRSSERCRHYLIDITDGNYAFLGSYKNTHSSLCELVEYHRNNAITTSEDDCELLVRPCCQKPSKTVYEELFSGTAYKCSQD